MDKSDKKSIGSMLKMEICDTIFNLHMEDQYKITSIVILVQLGCLFVSMILTMYGIKVGIYVAIYNVLLMFIVVINNNIHDRALKKARKRQSKRIDGLIDLLINVENLEDWQIQNKLIDILELDVPKLVSPKLDNIFNETDDDLKINKFKNTLKENAYDRGLTGFKDFNEQEYCVGDIVYNPHFENYWQVQRVLKDKFSYCGLTSPYVFVLCGDLNEYVIPIDDNKDFKIISKVDDVGYADIIREFISIKLQHNLEELEEMSANEST